MSDSQIMFWLGVCSALVVDSAVRILAGWIAR
jgi:hypothetical protein